MSIKKNIKIWVLSLAVSLSSSQAQTSVDSASKANLFFVLWDKPIFDPKEQKNLKNWIFYNTDIDTNTIFIPRNKRNDLEWNYFIDIWNKKLLFLPEDLKIWEEMISIIVKLNSVSWIDINDKNSPRNQLLSYFFSIISYIENRDSWYKKDTILLSKLNSLIDILWPIDKLKIEKQTNTELSEYKNTNEKIYYHFYESFLEYGKKILLEKSQLKKEDISIYKKKLVDEKEIWDIKRISKIEKEIINQIYRKVRELFLNNKWTLDLLKSSFPNNIIINDYNMKCIWYSTLCSKIFDELWIKNFWWITNWHSFLKIKITDGTEYYFDIQYDKEPFKVNYIWKDGNRDLISKDWQEYKVMFWDSDKVIQHQMNILLSYYFPEKKYDYLNKAIKLFPANPFPFFSYAYYLYQDKKLDEAFEYISKAHNMEPGDKITKSLKKIYY